MSSDFEGEMTGKKSELKTGKRPNQLCVKTLNENEILFEEGSTGKEFYIIQDGKLGVFKNTPEGSSVHLATIEKNGMVGEMAMLDNQPRSATVKALEKTHIAVINEKLFQATMQKAPVWLNSIIKIIISRLRDANLRVDQTVLRDKERGIISLMFLLLPHYCRECENRLGLEFETFVIEAYYVCRLKKKEVEKILERLHLRKIISLEQNSEKKKIICISDLEIVHLFYEFLTLKSQKKTFREINISEDCLKVLSNIAYVAQKFGKQSDEGTSLQKSVFLSDMSDKDTAHIEQSLLELRRKNLLVMMPEDDDIVITFQPIVFTRIKKIKEWLPRFEMEIEE